MPKSMRQVHALAASWYGSHTLGQHAVRTQGKISLLWSILHV